MEINKIIERLKLAGHKYGDCAINSDGKLCVRIDDVSMFQEDAEHLLLNRATLKQIIETNWNKNLV